MANTLYGINEDMERSVKLQVLYPNMSRADPIGVETLFLAEANRKLISKWVTKSLLNLSMLAWSSISFIVNFGNSDAFINYFNDSTSPTSISLLQSIKTSFFTDLTTD